MTIFKFYLLCRFSIDEKNSEIKLSFSTVFLSINNFWC